MKPRPADRILFLVNRSRTILVCLWTVFVPVWLACPAYACMSRQTPAAESVCCRSVPASHPMPADGSHRECVVCYQSDLVPAGTPTTFQPDFSISFDLPPTPHFVLPAIDRSQFIPLGGAPPGRQTLARIGVLTL